MATTSDAQLRAVRKYNDANTVLVQIRLNHKNDADIIRQLEQVNSKAGYIKALIREDMNKG
jgi:uncharacterized protein YpiB (UPF0302 family)